MPVHPCVVRDLAITGSGKARLLVRYHAGRALNHQTTLPPRGRLLILAGNAAEKRARHPFYPDIRAMH